MKKYLARWMVLTISVVLFAQGDVAKAKRTPGNESLLEIVGGFLEGRIYEITPPHPDVSKPISQVPPERVWKMARAVEILPAEATSLYHVLALQKLTKSIEHHPLKSDFVDLMLRDVATSDLPVRKPKTWDEVAIFGAGGTSGVLISGVVKIARPSDCPKIVDAILATKDEAKIAWLRKAAATAETKDVFETLLRGADERRKVNEQPPSSSAVGQAILATRQPTPEMTIPNSRNNSLTQGGDGHSFLFYAAWLGLISTFLIIGWLFYRRF